MRPLFSRFLTWQVSKNVGPNEGPPGLSDLLTPGAAAPVVSPAVPGNTDAVPPHPQLQRVLVTHLLSTSLEGAHLSPYH